MSKLTIDEWRKRAVAETIRYSSAMHVLADVRKELDDAQQALRLGDDNFWAESAVARAYALVSEVLTDWEPK